MNKQKWEVHCCNSIRTFLYLLSAWFGAGTFSILYKKTKKANDNSNTQWETPFLSTLRNCSVTCLKETHSFFVVYFANLLYHEVLIETRLNLKAKNAQKLLFTHIIENLLYVKLDLDFPFLSMSWKTWSSLKINSIFNFQVNYNVSWNFENFVLKNLWYFLNILDSNPFHLIFIT